jgi:hypothetical protein
METEALRKEIRSRGHFDIEILPKPYRQGLLPDGKSRARAWQECEERIMGWAYPAPYLEREAIDNGEYLEMPVDYEGFLEVVRLYRSGQVRHLRAFFEDWPERRTRRMTPEEGDEPYLWVDGLLGTLTGLYRFAGRLGSHTDSLEVELRIRLQGTEGRRLRISNSIFPFARGSDITKVPAWTHRETLPDGVSEDDLDVRALIAFGELCVALSYTIPRDHPHEWKGRQDKL